MSDSAPQGSAAGLARLTPERLAAKHVPAVFASHPTLELEPKPHLVLPSPFEEYCVTFYSPDDYDDVRAISIHPKIVPYFGPKGPDDPMLEPIVKWTHGWMLRENPELPFQVIRETAKVKQWTEGTKAPPFLGSFGFGRCDFYDLPAEERKVLQEKEKTLPLEKANLQSNVFAIHPDHGKKGLFTSALRYVLDTWFVPLQGPKGQIISGWDLGNENSARAHQRAGFKIIGKSSPADPKATVHVMAIWQGDGQVKKEDTVFKNFVDV